MTLVLFIRPVVVIKFCKSLSNIYQFEKFDVFLKLELTTVHLKHHHSIEEVPLRMLYKDTSTSGKTALYLYICFGE